ncbi:uncharacterized protein LOC126260332 [Schistocerca nitens]|uniref:uncharacterized protein LOC126260332 n=1 Tax=Schistocerca nitens TaxID=7011 RepID=UPI002117B7A7|nr:uncharacterized protein LOC126260332 [Schistocerca nitens]
MRKWYRVRDNVCTHLKVVHMAITSKLQPCEFDVFDREVRQGVSDLIHDVFLRQNTKLSMIRKEQKVLDKGFKYAPPHPPSEKQLDVMKVDIEYALTKDTTAKYIVANALKNETKFVCNIPQSIDFHTMKSLKLKLQHQGIVATKSDKGNSIVLLNKCDYVDKVNDFLNTTGFQILPKDPTKLFKEDVKYAIISCKSIFSEFEVKLLTNMNPVPPRMYGLPKLHKQDVPIRPVVSSFTAPSYKLASKLDVLIKSKTKFKPKHGISNSVDLVITLKGISVSHSDKLVSFDVSSLFSNIPVIECIDILTELMQKSNVNPEELNDLRLATQTCLAQNYFQFQGTLYKQLDG